MDENLNAFLEDPNNVKELQKYNVEFEIKIKEIINIL